MNHLLNPVDIPWWNMVVLSFVATAGFSDLIWHKIPRRLAFLGFIAGILFRGVTGGILNALAAAVIAFAIGIIFFRLGAIGGGDVKLITALAAMLGLGRWLFAMEAAIFAAAAIAIIQALFNRKLLQTFRNLASTASWLVRSGFREHPEINVRNTTLLRAPFGVAAALGTFVAVLR